MSPMDRLVDSEWDLIVVGAGSSGAALAARVAERGRRVLLLEAGPDLVGTQIPEEWRSPNPLRALLAPPEPSLVWPEIYATRTDAQAPALYWRGYGVGGSSLINGQIAIRPPLADFDEWGLPGWAGADVLPYFCRLESDQDYAGESCHGESGPIPVFRTDPADWGAVDRAVVEAARGIGLPWNDDINAPGATGVSRYPINSRDGRRISTNDAYLEPLRSAENLTIMGNILVDSILFSASRAVGVRAIVDDQSVDIHSPETVLCAGVVHSPAILLRSGIGPASRLKDLAIDCRANLPVGESFQDHAMVGVGLLLRAEAAIPHHDARHTNVAIRTTSQIEGAPSNDLMIVAMNQSVLAMEFADKTLGQGGIGVFLNRVTSRGQVLVQSADPRHQPFIRENMLSTTDDLERLRDGIQLVLEIARRPEVSRICAAPVEEINKELVEAAGASDPAALNALMRSTAADTQHGSGTCRIGRDDDPRTVVDSECRVLGIDGLRVADASIFPFVPRANTHLAAVMVGERMADILVPLA